MGMDGGMDMASDGLFKDVNMGIARNFWIVVGTVVVMLGLRRGLDGIRRIWRYVQPSNDLSRRPSRCSSTRASDLTGSRKRAAIRLPATTIATPSNVVSQAYDTLIAIGREISYAQPARIPGIVGRLIVFPSIGRSVLLIVYWMVILIMLWSNVILPPDSSIYAYRWEIVGFRAAWVSVTQLPLIYCLAGKINIISLVSGISYERLNWLHRWTARTIFLTLIVHWSFFLREWILADLCPAGTCHDAHGQVWHGSFRSYHLDGLLEFRLPPCCSVRDMGHPTSGSRRCSALARVYARPIVRCLQRLARHCIHCL